MDTFYLVYERASICWSNIINRPTTWNFPVILAQMRNYANFLAIPLDSTLTVMVVLRVYLQSTQLVMVIIYGFYISAVADCRVKVIFV